MQTIKFNVVKPVYVYLQLIPNNSIRNNQTNKLAKTINSLYKNIITNIKKDNAKLIKFFGKEFLLGLKYTIEANPKVSYFIYMEKQKAEFYMIVPEKYYSIIKEKINDVWSGLTVNKVAEVPTFKDSAVKYQLVYNKEDALSLAVDRRTNELLESNLNILDVLHVGDKVGIFYNFMPTNQLSWPHQYRATLDKASNGLPTQRNKLSFTYLLRVALMAIQGNFASLSSILTPAHNTKIQQDTLLIEALRQHNTQRTITDYTIKKGSDTVINTQVLVLSESSDKVRQVNNGRSLAQSFDAISTQDNSLKYTRYVKKFNPLVYNAGAETNKFSSAECTNFLALPGRELLERYPFIDKVQTQETEVPDELKTGVMCIGENVCKGKKQKAFLSTDFDYQFLSLVLIGPNRAGKSKLLANLARNAVDNGECVIIPDYIGSCQLSAEIADVIPLDKVLTIECDNPNTLQGLGYNEVPKSNNSFVQYKNAKEQTALLMTLVDSINADDANFTARMGRYFEAASLVVFLQNGSIKDVFAVLMQHNTRKQFIKNLPQSQRENMQEYIEYLQELDAVEKGQVVGTRSHLITGAIDRLQRLKTNAYIETMLKKGTKDNINLVHEMQKPQLIVIKMPQRMFLTDNEKDVYTTYWLTKIWLALQIREEQIQDRNKMLKVNLMIDELYQVNNAERFLTKKLSQLPKFNIKPIISCHYLNQIKIIREELRAANASYMLFAGCDKQNYNELKSEAYPFVEEDLLNLPRYHSLNIIKCSNGYGKFITKLPKPIKI